MKICTKCNMLKPLNEFHKQQATKDKHAYQCKNCDNQYSKQYRGDHATTINAYKYQWKLDHPERRLVSSARKRAKKLGVPFTITFRDVRIPEFCPVLGIKLAPGKKHVHDSSPSLDRIIPELGYVPGNIAIISVRANRIKSNSTAQELRKIADWIEAQT